MFQPVTKSAPSLSEPTTTVIQATTKATSIASHDHQLYEADSSTSPPKLPIKTTITQQYYSVEANGFTPNWKNDGNYEFLSENTREAQHNKIFSNVTTAQNCDREFLITTTTTSADASSEINNLNSTTSQQEQQINYANISADTQQIINSIKHSHKRPKTTPTPLCESSSNIKLNANETGYQLRALNPDLTALHENPWTEASKLSEKLQSVALSNELVTETLNYFVNCRQRLSQMTKTYDDNDAYILLLQEKEVDLELAARIGQDLLKQNKELKNLIKNLQIELTTRQDDVQQLKHELASKTSLLDTFIEEEEQQSSFAIKSEEQPLSSLQEKQQLILNKPGTSSNCQQSRYASSSRCSNTRDDDVPSGFLSLNYNQTKPPPTQVEPFTSLPYYLINSNTTDTQEQLPYPLTRDNSADTLGGINNTLSSRSLESQKLVEDVTFQLVESNKRLCELQDEILYKGEQNVLQQEKIYNLQDQLKESDRRLDDIAAENEALRKSIEETREMQQKLTEELESSKRNFNELLNVFLEFQKETKINRNLQQSSNATYYAEIDPVNDLNNISFDSFSTAQPESQNNPLLGTNYQDHHQPKNTNLRSNQFEEPNAINTHHEEHSPNRNIVRPLSRSGIIIASSLQEELQETMRNICDIDHSDGEATDECDSGVHTRKSKGAATNDGSSSSSSTSSTGGSKARRLMLSTTPTSSLVDGQTDTDSESTANDDSPAPSKRNWSEFSTFFVSTFLILCLSVTLTTSANPAQKLRSS